MKDPYAILGVAKSASAADIKSAYRKLAKKLHPDANPGDQAVEQRFKEVSQAYSILGDAEKRKRFDRGEIDANGQERGFGGFHGASGFGQGQGQAHPGGGFGFGPDFKPEDLFSELFGGRRGRGQQQGHQQRRKIKGLDLKANVTVNFKEAALGCKKRVQVSNGKTLEMRIPPGTEDGQTLRLKGQGGAGQAGGPAGDILITVTVQPHKHFTIKDKNIYLELPVTLHEALLGAEIDVPTIDGKVTMKVPPGSNAGTTLRLKGKGLPNATGKDGGRGKESDRGDQYVKLRLVLPDKPDQDLSDFVETWSKTHDYNPRKKAGLEDL